MTTQTVTAHIPKELVSKVDAMAAQLDRPRGWAVKQALMDWVALEEERQRMLQEAFDDVEAGRLVPQTQASLWLRSLATDNPLPRPETG